ncbi:hypothetical protein BKA67DRAFT_193288 [Truncatella angustata]|uniref:Uncharacterized protein n=1 Tax=Truncatella angustata TaxID=152316 RepID=A0A9P8USF4_9PEZI|nr:uncharacterized protein BKA67DRAFT_193288 [Truncatella angustata]KAH6657612.1 hypothetical protein BKA67DRAFT_193288 [Truncatella angustata]
MAPVYPSSSQCIAFFWVSSMPPSQSVVHINPSLPTTDFSFPPTLRATVKRLSDSCQQFIHLLTCPATFCASCPQESRD